MDYAGRQRHGSVKNQKHLLIKSTYNLKKPTKEVKK